MASFPRVREKITLQVFCKVTLEVQKPRKEKGREGTPGQSPTFLLMACMVSERREKDDSGKERGGEERRREEKRKGREADGVRETNWEEKGSLGSGRGDKKKWEWG